MTNVIEVTHVFLKMENCEYSKIYKDIGIEVNEYEKSTWKPLMRQCMITSGICCVNFMQGLFLGAPTVLVAQIRADENTTEIVSDEMLSWITTTPSISAVPSLVILPLLFNRIGRKLTFIFVWLSITIGFIIFYNSSSLYHVLISEVCAGPAFASTVSISPVMIAEYTSPKYRGILLTLKAATAFWGIWTANAIGSFFHWKNIAKIAFVCSVYIISMLAWPESPYWLAKRGRYAESAKSHRWLKGVNKISEKEFIQLIISQRKMNRIHLPLSSGKEDFSSFSGLSRMWSIITSRLFYKPVLISIILLALYHFSGKLVITMYAVEILKHLTPDESFVYKEMLILDGVTVFSMYGGCIISRFYKRRTLLLLFSSTGISLLYILFFYLYLTSWFTFLKNDILILLLLTVFSIVISCGPMILGISIYGEIIPPRHQNAAMIVVGLGSAIIMSLLLKLSPMMFKTFKIHGSFLFYAISSTLLLIVLYIYLPETKDKTIQEIEESFTKKEVLGEHDKKTAHEEIELNSLML